jgi:predicted ATPase
LANVIQYLGESNPDRLKKILDILSKRIPQLERVDAELLTDGRLLLQIKDAPFERPILARFASDGTLKMLAYLVLIYDPEPAPFIGIEEPENYLHPRLLPELVEECGLATNRTQLMMTTHSPFILNSLQPEQVRILHRGKDGYTIATRVADIQGIREMKEEGAALGDLWMEGYFGRGDPMGDKGN